MEKDPVCGMIIRAEDAAGSITYKGEKYFFCAPGCKVSFIKNPKKYVIQNSSGMDKESRTNHSKCGRKDEQS
ncbi:MAG: YHS domain-containing protein [Ignavibacteriaceae bacterium]